MKNHNNPSQTVKILNYLLKGKSLTPLEALSRFKCFRLASRINEINRSGIKVEKEMVNKNGKRYAKYFLKKKAAKALAIASMLVSGFVQAQDTVNYSGYSYQTGYGNNSPTYNYGQARISSSERIAQETSATVDRICRDADARNAERMRQLEASRQERQLRWQTDELKKQTRLLQEIADQ
jgi:hypothetical protein